jgi:hypothetical protein
MLLRTARRLLRTVDRTLINSDRLFLNKSWIVAGKCSRAKADQYLELPDDTQLGKLV